MPLIAALVSFLVNNAVAIGAVAGIATAVHESAETVKVVTEMRKPEALKQPAKNPEDEQQ